MAISQLKKTIVLGNAYKDNDGTLKSAAILPVDPDGRIRFKEPGVFLLNPSTITENKSSNWVQQNVPGQSDPVLQWVSSGPRTISFQALVTADTSDYISGQKIMPGKTAANPLDRIDTVFGGIAAKFFKTAVKQERTTTEQGQSTQLDITEYLNYYRSLLYPIYSDDLTNPKLLGSPPLVILLFGTAIAKFPYGDTITAQNDLWVVTNLEIQITKQLPNLAPMEAVVNFQLTQYNVRSFGRNRFFR